jgi:hypothetical protein
VLPVLVKPLPAINVLAEANNIQVKAVPEAPPIVIGLFVVKIHPLSALTVPSSTHTYAPAVTSASASKSVALSHTPFAPVPKVVTTQIPFSAPVDWSFNKILSLAANDTLCNVLGAAVI